MSGPVQASAVCCNDELSISMFDRLGVVLDNSALVCKPAVTYAHMSGTYPIRGLGSCCHTELQTELCTHLEQRQQWLTEMSSNRSTCGAQLPEHEKGMTKQTLSRVMSTLPSRAYSACKAQLGPGPRAFFLVSFCTKDMSSQSCRSSRSLVCVCLALLSIACPHNAIFFLYFAIHAWQDDTSKWWSACSCTLATQCSYAC